MIASLRRGAVAAACVAVAVASLCTTAHTADAQVGYNPDQSPYHDIDNNHDWYLFGGYWISSPNAAHVTPRSGPMLGARYDLLIAKTPIFFYGRAAHVFDDRTIINPTYPEAIRVLDPKAAASFNMADMGFGIQLTGHKSFHRFAPVFNVGSGVVTDLGGAGGPGKYHLGTQFAGVYGIGIRWIPDAWLNRLTLRIDANNYLYEHHLPRSFHTLTADGTYTVPLTTPLTEWRNNTALTAGIWYSFFR